MSRSDFSDILPNLPGFRASDVRYSHTKSQIFQIKKGEAFVKETVAAPDSLEELSVLSIGTKSRPQTSGGRTDVVLTYQGYYDEPASGAGPEIRQNVYIYFFVDDGSIKIVSAPKVRGGSKSGTKLRRTIVTREDGSPYTVNDFRLGETVTIYGRAYKIIDCNQTARDFVKSENGERDDFSYSHQDTDYKDILVKEEGPPSELNWSAFRPKKNPLKVYMEAKMGNTIDNSKREGFIAFGNKVLKFLCYWNESSLFGKRAEYVLIYHLADDTVDIVSSTNNSDGGEFPQLLKRSKLPKSSFSVALSDQELPQHEKEQFYHWSDFSIGSEIAVYSRNFVIIDADKSTRDFFTEHGIELAAGRKIEPLPAKVYVREIPPHVGFGSEEDSLRSCVGSLCAGPPRQKAYNFNARVLVFSASILSSNPDDKQRRFVISFYVDDSTIKILEPPLRNSGYVGGMFLSRQKLKNVNGKWFSEYDFEVGKTITVASHSFLLEGADKGTSEYLSERGANLG
jgi:hypothetical protein